MNDSAKDLDKDIQAKELFDKLKEIAVKAIDNESVNAQNILNLTNIPDNIKFAELKRFMDDNNIDFSKKMIIHYIEEGLLPNPEKPSPNQSIYSKDHIYLFLLIDKLKKHLKLEEIKPIMEVINFGLEQGVGEAQHVADIFFSSLDDTYNMFWEANLQAYLPYLLNSYKESFREDIVKNFIEGEDFDEEGLDTGLDLMSEYSTIRDLILMHSSMAISLFSVLNPLVDMYKGLQLKLESLSNQNKR